MAVLLLRLVERDRRLLVASRLVPCCCRLIYALELRKLVGLVASMTAQIDVTALQLGHAAL